MISLKFRQGQHDVVELLKDFGQSTIVTMQVKKTSPTMRRALQTSFRGFHLQSAQASWSV
jgi:hypothetical protein